MTQKPHRCRTGAPRGQTPILFHHFNWKSLSLIAGLSRGNLHFELFADTVKSPQAVIFLEKLLQVIPGKLLVAWDGLAAHRSRLVKIIWPPWREESRHFAYHPMRRN